MSKKKKFDCVEFQHEMFAKAWKRSGAKTMREYIDYIHEEAKNSSLYKNYLKNIEKESKSNINVEAASML